MAKTKGVGLYTKLFFVISLLAIGAVSFQIGKTQSFLQYAAGPQSTTSSISLNPSPVAALGNTVTFTVSYPKNTKNPWVSLTCYLDQAKTQVIYGEGGTAAQASGGGGKLGYQGFTLGGASSDWVGTYPTSSAYCTAELGNLYWKGGKEYYTYFASTSFTALGKQ